MQVNLIDPIPCESASVCPGLIEEPHHEKPHPKEGAGLNADPGRAEWEWMASQPGSGTIRLRPEWPSLLALLPNLGPVRCMTANQHATL